ncbi:hypothetical protein ACM1RC_32525 [Paenibacillus azoreducens]|uniref:hypothetical protein n=1 Tax=Paenibacillus azoreducens TaxID=116718 RepID=UPI0039F4DEAB
MASYVRRMAQSANELEQAYHQIPSELRQRWRANYDRYMAEQPKPKQEQSRSWLAILGEAQLQNAEAQVAAGKYVADVVGEVISGTGTAVVEDYTFGIMSKEYASNHPKAQNRRIDRTPHNNCSRSIGGEAGGLLVTSTGDSHL